MASAAYLAKLENRRGKFVISRGVHPHSRETLVTYAKGFGGEVVETTIGSQDEARVAALIEDL